MIHAIDLYWSMRSPFCYLALDRLLALDRQDDVTVNVKHVWPGAIRHKSYFKNLNPNYPSYHRRDTERLAEYIGLPYARPKPDPLVFDKQTMEPLPLADQPHIGWLTRVAQLAVEAGAGMAFLDPVTRLIWGGMVENWHEGEHMPRAVMGTGLDFSDLCAQADAEAERLDAIIDANNDTLSAVGHWGVPCMVFEDEPFFGQDRMALLNWRLDEAQKR